MQFAFVNYSDLRLFLDGMLAMMALYSILCFVQQRKTIYWQYALYISCMTLTFRLDDTDYTQAGYVPGANILVVVIESTAFLLYIRFAILLMNIRQNDPFSYRLLRFIFWFLVAETALETLLWATDVPVETRTLVYSVGRFLMAGGALVVVPRILKLRQQVVKYFIVGSSCFIFGCVLALMLNYIPNLFLKDPANPLTFPVTYIQLGVTVEVLCFTLGIALLNQQTERDRLNFQTELIKQFRENERKQTQLQRIRDDIARDLHDDLGADLGGISLLSDAATRQLAGQPDQARLTLRLIGETARTVSRTMREIVSSLRAAAPEAADFGLRLRETAYTLFEHAPAELHFDLPDQPPTRLMTSRQQRELFLMYKEILHNTLRHADARHVWVHWYHQSQTTCLSVRDDGRGFRPETIGPGGNGLASLHQRASDLQATLQIDTAPGQGTTLTVCVPLLTAVQPA
ncbi:MAG: hypothetical protein H7319_19865 [Spirosoma sp.]|nr:hypothetical protein [Spirosoma sp.]